MLLSVIVPVYNVEQYLRQCLDSLMAQTIGDFEVLIVNDGSSDHSQLIIDEYTAKHPHLFRSFIKPNGGLSDARNYALPYVQGEFLAFLDSDDYIEATTYEKMLAQMSADVDLVVSDIEYFFEDGSPSWIMKGLSEGEFNSVQKRGLCSPMFAWNKVVRTSMFKQLQLQYPVGTWYEDIPVSSILFAKSGQIGYVPQALFHYRQRSGSIMNARQSDRVQEIFHVCELLRERFAHARLNEEFHDELEYLHIEHLRLYGMFRFMRSPIAKSCFERSEMCMNTYFPKWKKNKYIRRMSLKNRIFLMTCNRATWWLYARLIK